MTNLQWRIWSNEHRAWWAPGRCGYTKHQQSAGLYSFEEAATICERANHHLTEDQEPHETMLPYDHNH